MLKKLIKYELKASGRFLLPVYAATILTGILSCLFARIIFEDRALDLSVPWVISVCLIVLYACLLAAAVVIGIIASVLRFKRGLLGSEGYVMHTLPVSAAQNIASKLTVAVIYQVCGIVVAAVSIFLSVIIMSGGAETDLSALLRAISAIAEQLGGHGVLALYIAEAAVFGIISLAQLNAMLYASLSAGHSFCSGKTVKSVAAFVIFYLISQIINTVLINIATLIPTYCFSSGTLPHLYMLGLIVLEIFYLAAYMTAADYFLKYKLNLE